MLHIVNKSPFEKSSLESCLRAAKAGASILLIEDGVYGALAGTAKSDLLGNLGGKNPIYVMGADLQARAVSEDRIMDGIKIIDYSDFVDLVVENESSLSWL